MGYVAAVVKNLSHATEIRIGAGERRSFLFD